MVWEMRYDTLTFDEHVTINAFVFYFTVKFAHCWRERDEAHIQSKIIEITGNEFIEAGN